MVSSAADFYHFLVKSGFLMLGKPLPIYVITVRSFVDRHRHIEKMAEKFGFSFEYVWRYDADELTDGELSKVCSSLSRKSASNVLKHIYAQQLFLETGSDVALILEDDVVIFDSFFRGLNKVLSLAEKLTPGWLIFLAGADNKMDARFFEATELDLINSPLTTAEAYVIDRHGCEQRARWLKENTISCQADHQLKLIDQELGLTHYCVSTPLATQGSITGLFATSLDSSRSKHGSLFLRVKYEYNRLRRQTAVRFIAKIKRVLSCHIR
jgi:GR25 family glycosyltransferase involved in LPS biosynthesis